MVRQASTTFLIYKTFEDLKMEINKVEFRQVEQTELAAVQFAELNDLQLALVGGGIGDTIL
jgi:hypothetical protein